MPPSPQTAKLTSTLHLLIPRLRLLQKKDTASSVVQRRDLANLLEEGRDASARIRVENVIATDIGVEVMEMVELYCELLLARANVLDQIAFGEQGARARNRAKEALKAEMVASGTGGSNRQIKSASASASRLGWSSIFGGGQQSKHQQQQTTPRTVPRAPDADVSTMPTPDPTHEVEEDEVALNPYMDAALDEAAASVFYAWSRFPHDVRELTIVRNLLAERYGKEFLTLAQDNKLDVKVPERLVKSLRVRPPTKELVESYLREIAKAYGVAWPKDEYDGPESDERARLATEELLDSLPSDEDEGTATADAPSTPQKQQEDRPDRAGMRRASEADELSKVNTPRQIASGRSPVSVAPPGPRTDNPNPRVRLPGTSQPGKGTETVGAPRGRKGNNSGGGNGIPELDELNRRFAALKKL